MKGRNEWPMPVVGEACEVVNRKVGRLYLDYAGVEERFEIAKLQGYGSAVMNAIHAANAESRKSGTPTPRALRVFLAERIAEYRTQVNTISKWLRSHA